MWAAVPFVMHSCNMPGLYDLPRASEAYALVHFLERYRRAWRTLEELTASLLLPLGVEGIRVLEVGSGPGSCLFAIADFYAALRAYGEEVKDERLCAQSTELFAVEKSHGMVSLMHALSEYGGRQGTFAATFSDFEGLDLEAGRSFYRRQYMPDYADEETF